MSVESVNTGQTPINYRISVTDYIQIVNRGKIIAIIGKLIPYYFSSGKSHLLLDYCYWTIVILVRFFLYFDYNIQYSMF